jgi:hypothetical protein
VRDTQLYIYFFVNIIYINFIEKCFLYDDEAALIGVLSESGGRLEAYAGGQVMFFFHVMPSSVPSLSLELQAVGWRF